MLGARLRRHLPALRARTPTLWLLGGAGVCRSACCASSACSTRSTWPTARTASCIGLALIWSAFLLAHLPPDGHAGHGGGCGRGTGGAVRLQPARPPVPRRRRELRRLGAVRPAGDLLPTTTPSPTDRGRRCRAAVRRAGRATRCACSSERIDRAHGRRSPAAATTSTIISTPVIGWPLRPVSSISRVAALPNLAAAALCPAPAVCVAGRDRRWPTACSAGLGAPWGVPACHRGAGA